jgi:hypothetical protein
MFIFIYVFSPTDKWFKRLQKNFNRKRSRNEFECGVISLSHQQTQIFKHVTAWKAFFLLFIFIQCAR